MPPVKPMQTKATPHNGKPGQDWQGPRVHAIMEVVTYQHETLPIGQKGMSLGQYVDDMLANAREDNKVVGKLTLDFADSNM